MTYCRSLGPKASPFTIVALTVLAACSGPDKSSAASSPVPDRTMAPAIIQRATPAPTKTKMKPKAHKIAVRQVSTLDDACYAVQTKFMNDYGMNAGCDWNFPNGPEANAVFTLHVPAVQFANVHVSKESLLDAATLALASISRGPFGASANTIIVDPE